MGLKANTSFLQFLTMGAVGARAVLDDLKRLGFEPVELERPGMSNKLWSTKVKRLRLPDILCTKTGVRIEVRAKSDLAIRMSDAPDNEERRWDVGLRDQDLVAFIPCTADGAVAAVGSPTYFTVRAMRDALPSSKLSEPKSQSEGSERDREWPSSIAGGAGKVAEITDTKVVVQTALRKVPIQLKNKSGTWEKVPLVKVGDEVVPSVTVLASVIRERANLDVAKARSWDPIALLKAETAVERYCAAKALRFRSDLQGGKAALAAQMEAETDPRVKLEIAASLAALGEKVGFDAIEATLGDPARGDLRMEAALILAELKTATAGTILKKIAADKTLAGNELRQAAVWGLGLAGVADYAELVSYIADEEDDVALHAICGFATTTPDAVLDALVAELRSMNARVRAAASAALRQIGSDAAIDRLIAAAREHTDDPWILATLGQMSPARVRDRLRDDPLLKRLLPMLTLNPETNWLATDDLSLSLEFLRKQRP